MASGNPPVLIVGMHRSGTTMVASMLRDLGLFIGNDLEENSESLFFVSHNKWLLKQCAGDWGSPSAVSSLFSEARLISLVEHYLRERLARWPARRYLGMRRYASGQCLIEGLSKPWGWKDPRNTFTLPVWERLFPNARVIYIVRNGVSVAASLRRRAESTLRQAEISQRTRLQLGIYQLLPKGEGFVDSPRCLSLRGAFGIWEEYTAHAHQLLKASKLRILNVRYEEFLRDPEGMLCRIAEFGGLECDTGQVRMAAGSAIPEKAQEIYRNQELVEFYNEVKDARMMRLLGYADSR